MSPSCWLGSAVAIVILAQPAVAQAKPDSVALRFAWPVGMAANVEGEWTRMQSTPARNDSFTVRSRWRMMVSPHAKGRLIQYDQFTITSLPPATPNRSPAGLDPHQLLARLGSIQPSYVVSAEGEFVSVEGVEAMKRALDSLLAPIMSQIAGAPPAIKAMLENATSMQVLTAAAAQDWNAVAGTWVGADWEVGAVYETSTEEPVPMFPGLKIPMQYQFRAAERVPCTERETARRCVRLEMHSEPDSVAMRKFINDLMTKVVPNQANALAMFKSMRVANELTVIADPRDLRPYSFELVKAVEAESAGGPNEPAGRTRQIDIRTARYTYIR